MTYKKKTTKDYDDKEHKVSVNIRGEKYIFLPKRSSFEQDDIVIVKKKKTIKSISKDYMTKNEELIKRLADK